MIHLLHGKTFRVHKGTSSLQNTGPNSTAQLMALGVHRGKSLPLPQLGLRGLSSVHIPFSVLTTTLYKWQCDFFLALSALFNFWNWLTLILVHVFFTVTMVWQLPRASLRDKTGYRKMVDVTGPICKVNTILQANVCFRKMPLKYFGNLNSID